MATYVERALGNGELVEATANQHWAMFIIPVVWILLGWAFGANGWLFLAIGIVMLAWRALVYLTTELALTNRRVIARYGVLNKHVIDLSLSRVEGVTFTQSIVGRIFGFGALVVRGTGVGNVPIRFISHPEVFRDQINRAIHPS